MMMTYQVANWKNKVWIVVSFVSDAGDDDDEKMSDPDKKKPKGILQ